MIYLCYLYLGIGTGLVLSDVIDNGLPDSWEEWVDFAFCPFLWPVAIYRRLSGR